MKQEKLEERFMIQWLYGDDTEDKTYYMNREEVINRFKQTFPFVQNENFEQSQVTIGTASVKIVKL